MNEGFLNVSRHISRKISRMSHIFNFRKNKTQVYKNSVRGRRKKRKKINFKFEANIGNFFLMLYRPVLESEERFRNSFRAEH